MRIIGENISVFNAMFWRFLVTSILIGLVLLPKIGSLNIGARQLMEPVITGMLFYGTGSGIYFIASQYIGTGLAIVIFFTYPAIVMLCNWFLYGHKVTKIYYISIFLILFGLVLLVDKEDFALNLYGIILAILTAVTYAAYILVSKKQIAHLPPLVSTLMVSFGSCIACLMITLLDGSFTVPHTNTAWGNILGISIICTALPILFLLEGLKYIKSEKASILSVLEPVCVFIVGVTVLGEQVSLVQTIGVTTLLGGALLVQLDRG